MLEHQSTRNPHLVHEVSFYTTGSLFWQLTVTACRQFVDWVTLLWCINEQVAATSCEVIQWQCIKFGCLWVGLWVLCSPQMWSVLWDSKDKFWKWACMLHCCRSLSDTSADGIGKVATRAVTAQWRRMAVNHPHIVSLDCMESNIKCLCSWCSVNTYKCILC